MTRALQDLAFSEYLLLLAYHECMIHVRTLDHCNICHLFVFPLLIVLEGKGIHSGILSRDIFSRNAADTWLMRRKLPAHMAYSRYVQATVAKRNGTSRFIVDSWDVNKPL